MLELNPREFIRKVTTKDAARVKVSRLERVCVFRCVESRRNLGSRVCQDL